MKVIRIRSIEEAKRLELPLIPGALLEAARHLQQRAAVGTMSRHAVLRSIYDLVDRTAAVIEDYTVCSAGCSHCCRIPVIVTELEASYIEKNVGRAARRGVRTGPPVPGGTPCPFLDEGAGRCTIYAVRPFPCRAYATFDDPKHCADHDTEHVTYGPRSNPIFVGSQQFIMHLNGRGAVADIRSFFPGN